MRLEGRRDRVRPDVLEAEDPEQGEPEQRERDKGHEGAERDCRGVGQEAVLGEALIDIVRGLTQAAGADGCCFRRHTVPLPSPARGNTLSSGEAGPESS